MKVKKYQGNDERTILTALIVHDDVLRRVHGEIGKDSRPFKNRWANLLCKWCFDYYKKYQKAPRSNIENLFQKFAQGERDEATVEIVEQFLHSLSRGYTRLAKGINEQWVIDLASRYFEMTRLGRKLEALQGAFDSGDLDEIKLVEAKYSRPISFGAKDWASIASAENIYETMRYYEEDHSIIRFPGALGKFLSPAFERDSFIAFAAPEKKGKSYWLMEVVWQALRQRRRVLYYILGDMSLRQVSERFYRRISLQPRRAREIKYPVKLEIVEPDKNDEKSDGQRRAEVGFDDRRCEGMTALAVRRAVRKLKVSTGTKELFLRTKTVGASVISASDIERDVQSMSREGWVPEVVVIDYADLMAPEPEAARQDYRHQVNESWKVLRRISTDYHLCLVTATQAAARSYDQRLIRKKDFSEDKRKNAHVTGMIGINQTSGEKKSGIYRLNWVFLRDGDWSEDQVVWTVGNLALACPCLKSSL